MKTVDELDAFRRFVQRAGSQKAAGEKVDLAQSYVSDILKGYRRIPARVLDKMGLRRAVVPKRFPPRKRQLVGSPRKS